MNLPFQRINTKDYKFKCCGNCKYSLKLESAGDIWCEKHKRTNILLQKCDKWKLDQQVIIGDIIKDLSTHSRSVYLNTARLLRKFLISQGYSEQYVRHLKLKQLSKITDRLLNERRFQHG